MALVQCVYAQGSSSEEEEAQGWDAEAIVWE
jgi:hypothetical protein